MADFRACKQEEFNRWREFLDRNFGYEAPQSYAIDFAPLFEPESLSRSKLVWQGDQIVASATVFPIKAIINEKSLNLAIIGAVATDPAFRGQGLSKRVMTELETQALSSGNNIDGFILWSELQDFYEPMGYRYVGTQLVCALDRLEPPTALPGGSIVYGWDWPQVRKIYEKHSLRIARSDDHWRALKNINSCTRIQWISDRGEVLAYAGFDRGKDLQGIIHEWGGDPLALHGLVWALLQARPGLLWLTRVGLNDPFQNLGVHSPENVVAQIPLGLFKPVTPNSTQLIEKAWFWGLDSL